MTNYKIFDAAFAGPEPLAVSKMLGVTASTVAEYYVGHDSGGNLLDISGNSRTLTRTGNPLTSNSSILDRDGNPLKQVVLNGSQYFIRNYEPWMNIFGSDFCVSIVFYSPVTLDAERIIFSRGASGSGGIAITQDNNGYFRAYLYKSPSGSINILYNQSFMLGYAHVIHVVRSGTSFYLYVNGATVSPTDPSTYGNDTTSHLYFGRNYTGSVIYSRLQTSVLTANQISYEVAYWRGVAASKSSKTAPMAHSYSRLFGAKTERITGANRIVTTPSHWPVRDSDKGILAQGSSYQDLVRTNEFMVAPWTGIDVTETDITPHTHVRTWTSIATDSTGTNLVACVYDGYIYTSSDSGASWTKRASVGKWSCVVSNATGTRLAACQGDPTGYRYGLIFTSSDSGATWTARETSNPRIWAAIASDSTGQYLAACSYYNSAAPSGYIYTSNDWGVTWTQRASSNYWRSTASSSTGQYLVACVYNGSISTSSNYGVNWTAQASGTRNWKCVASNSTGQKLVACVGGESTGYIYTSSDYGVTWTEQTLSGNRKWYAVASDSSGSNLLACVCEGGAIYQSTDSGVNWSVCTGPGAAYWANVASDSDGTNLMCCAGYKTSSWSPYTGHIFTSSDSGVNWTVCTDPSDDYYHGSAYPSARSTNADGSVIAIADYMTIYVSTDSGNTWTRWDHGIYDGYPQYVCVSSSGSFMALIGSNSQLYVSYDYGASWKYRSGFSLSMVSAFCMDGTGQRMAAAQTYNGIYISSDYGITWTKSNAPDASLSWQGIAASSNGVVWAAGLYPGGFYVSTDYGLNWTSRAVSGDARNIAIDADGSNIIVAAGANSNGYIFTSSDYGVSWTQRTSAGNRMWYGAASDSTGTKLFACSSAGLIYRSTDGGVNWTSCIDAGAGRWWGLSSDSTGTNIIAMEGEGVNRRSTDGGSTWVPITWYSKTNPRLIWKNTASDDDGSFIVTSGPGTYIYTSSDYGNTWTESTAAGARNWTGIYVDADGSNIIACATSGYVYTSSDSGVTWTEHIAAGSRNWSCVALDSTGTTLVAAVGVGSGYIYTSPDGGTNWYERTGPGSRVWQDIDMSSSGQYVIAAGAGTANLYVSSDYGVNWLPRGDSKSYVAVACSSDGLYMYAWDGTSGGYIYKSSNWGTSWSQTFNVGYTNYRLTCSASGAYIFCSSSRYRPIYSYNSFTNYGYWSKFGYRYGLGLDCNASGKQVIMCGAPSYNNIYITWLWKYTLSDPEITMGTTSTPLSPDGTASNYKLISSSNNTKHSLQQPLTSSHSVGSGSFEIDAFPGDRDWLYLACPSIANAYAYFNVRSGTVGTVGSNCLASANNTRFGLYVATYGLPVGFELAPAAGDGVLAFAGDGVTPSIYIWEASAQPQRFHLTPLTRSTEVQILKYEDSITYPITFFPNYSLGSSYSDKKLIIEVRVKCRYNSVDDIGENTQRGIVCIGGNTGTATSTRNNVIIYGYNQYVYASLYDSSGGTQRYMRHVVTDAKSWHTYRVTFDFSNLSRSTFTKDGVLHTESGSLTGTTSTLDVTNCLLRIGQSYVSTGSQYQTTGFCSIDYLKIWVGN